MLNASNPSLVAQILVFLFAASIFAQTQPTSSQPEAVFKDKNRVARLISASRSHEPAIREQALRQLSCIAKYDNLALERIIEAIFSSDAPITIDNDPCVFTLLRYLPNADSSLARRRVDAYSHRAQDRVILEEMLIVLGRMGDKAKTAGPFLHSLLKDVNIEPEDKAAIRVTLANVEGNTERLTQDIRSDIRARSEAGQLGMWMMFFTHPVIWGPETVSDLLAWLGEKNREGLEAVGVLGLLRNRAITALPAIEQYARDNPESSTLCWYAIALIDSSRRAGSVENALKSAATKADPALLVWLSLWLPDDMVTETVLALKGKEALVRRGAMLILFFVGPSAREAVPVLMDILTACGDSDLRKRAAETLARVGDASAIPQMEAAKRVEQSSLVREAIERGIRILRLTEPASCTKASSQRNEAAGEQRGTPGK